MRKFTIGSTLKIKMTDGSIRTVEVLSTLCNLTYIGWNSNGQYCKAYIRTSKLKEDLV